MLDKIKSILLAVQSDLKDIWNRSKIAILAIIGVILAIEFNKLKEYITIYMGKKEIDNAKKEDETLAKQEKTANSEADVLVKQAEDLPKQEPEVDLDWNKK